MPEVRKRNMDDADADRRIGFAALSLATIAGCTRRTDINGRHGVVFARDALSGDRYVAVARDAFFVEIAAIDAARLTLAEGDAQAIAFMRDTDHVQSAAYKVSEMPLRELCERFPHAQLDDGTLLRAVRPYLD